MKFYDLFCGIGGFRLGLERRGHHECIGSCDIDKYARLVYENRFGEEPYHDARELDASTLKFDCLCAGFPCQAFSYAGQRLGFADARGTLFLEIARIAKEARPQYLFLENVKGLLNHDKGRTFGTILNTLYELGYDVEWQVINGKYFVPQNRERVFIIGHLREKPSRQVFPLPDSCQSYDSTCTKTSGQGQRIRSPYSTAIDSSYFKGWGGNRTMIVMAHTQGNMKQRIQDRDETWNLDTSGSKMGIIEMTNRENQSFRVYDPKGISPTLNTSGGGNHEPKITIKNRIRKLTPLECERLMGLPDDWTLVGDISNTQRYKLIGNSVIVPIIEYIGSFL